MIRINEDKCWSVIIDQVRVNKFLKYKLRASPILIGGSNIMNTFFWNYKNLNWQMSWRGLPGFFLDVSTNSKFIEKLDLMLTFS